MKATPDQPCEAKWLLGVGKGGEEASSSAPSTADFNLTQPFCCLGPPCLPGYRLFWLTDFSLQTPTSSDWANDSAALTET